MTKMTKMEDAPYIEESEDSIDKTTDELEWEGPIEGTNKFSLIEEMLPLSHRGS